MSERKEYKMFKERCDDAGMTELVILFEMYEELDETMKNIQASTQFGKHLKYIEKCILKLDPTFFYPE